MDLVRRILTAFQSTDVRLREEAVSLLYRSEFTTAEACRLIEAAGDPFPAEEDSGKHPANELLDRFQNDNHSQELVAAVERVYDRLEGIDGAQQSALRILAEMKTPEALQTVAQLLGRPSSRQIMLDYVFVPLIGSREWPKGTKPDPAGVAMFPSLFAAIDDLQDGAEHVYYVILKYVYSGLLNLRTYPRFGVSCVSAAARIIAEDVPELEAVEAGKPVDSISPERCLELPTEMGRSPEQIECVGTREFRHESGELQVCYFFRFRHSQFSDGKWYAGMAGPYPAAGPPRIGGRDTFSRFREWDSKPIEQHILDYPPWSYESDSP